MKCEIDDTRVFLQVIKECRNPLAVLREALSNSYDAGASQARVDLQGAQNAMDLEVEDNGRGIRPIEFRYFFGLGFGNKEGRQLIGNKGLGTKLYFNSSRVQVETRLSTGGNYRAVMDGPMTQLESGLVPEYAVSRAKTTTLRFRTGTKICIRGLAASPRSPLLVTENIANYLKWFTAAGSCRRIFGVRPARRFAVKISRRDLGGRQFRVEGHNLPVSSASANQEHSSFAAQFDPFALDLESDDGEPLGQLEVAGSIVGPDGHIVRDRRVKKQFKGVFLSKDYFIVRNVSPDVFGGTGEWQSTHIVANCQQFHLSMSRDEFIETGPGSTYAEALSALRTFANCLRRGERFKYRGRTIEVGAQFAGACYSRLKSLRNMELDVERDHMRMLNLVKLSEAPKNALSGDGGPMLTPIDPIGVLLVFQSLVSKHRRLRLRNDPSKPILFRVIGYSDQPQGGVLVQKQEQTKWSRPLFYAPYLTLSELRRTDPRVGLDGVICWSIAEGRVNVPPSIDVVVLEDAF